MSINKAVRKIIQDINAAQGAHEALQIMVQSVKAVMKTDACNVLLVDTDTNKLVLVATDGFAPSAVGSVRVSLDTGLVGVIASREEPLNLKDSSKHPKYVFIPEIGEEKYRGYLGVPIIHYRQLLGVITVLEKDERCFEEDEEAFLVTISLHLAALLATMDVTELIPAEADSQVLSQIKPKKERVVRGVGCVPGVATGQGLVVYPPADLESVPERTTTETSAELDLFEKALQSTISEVKDLYQRLSETVSPEEASLFDAYLKMLDSNSLGNEIRTEIMSGHWAQGALKRVIKRHINAFEAMDDDYLRERTTDIRDVGRRLLSHLQRSAHVDIEYPEQTILVGEEVTAAAIASVPDGRLVGIVSMRGSKNSHAAILGRALNAPTVMGFEGLALNRFDGERIIVDGYEGQVHLSPSEPVFQEYMSLAEEERELDEGLQALRDVPAQTPDNHVFAMHVNTGLAADAGNSLTVGAEGIGLYRTEIPFLTRDRFPSEKEQTVIYKQILKAFSPRPVVMRTLDIGGDKILPYFPVSEENPFLGWRGIRVTLDHPEIFLMQVRAMLRASLGINNLSIMLPMISGISEVNDARRLIDQAFEEVQEEDPDVARPPLGVMIEIPSAVYQTSELARMVDFVSVGSNDLTQYLLAVDRNNPRVANLYDALHPSVLRALMHVVENAHKEGIPVSICGEMAGDPAAVILLIAMGFDAFSMNSSSLPRVKWVVRNFTVSRARELLEAALKMDSPAQIHECLELALDKAGLGGLIRAGKY